MISQKRIFKIFWILDDEVNENKLLNKLLSEVMKRAIVVFGFGYLKINPC